MPPFIDTWSLIGQTADRQDTISRWPIFFRASGNGSFADLTNQANMDGLSIGVHPIPVVKNFRMDWYSLRITHATASSVTFSWSIRKYTACNLSVDTSELFDVADHDVAIESPGCFDGRFPESIEFEPGDFWRPEISCSPAAFNPRIRFVLQGDLR